MPEFSDIQKQLSNIEGLEKDLHLKQLQINRLLSITQAINNNVSAAELYSMYSSFLGWELGVKKMTLYVMEEDESWICAASLNIPEALLNEDISTFLPHYTRLRNLEENEHPLIKHFDVVIPVRHKEQAIAYVFIGGFNEEEDMYNKIQLITTITNVISVAIENKRLFKRQMEQERLRQEMDLAGEVQRMLIPKILPSTPNYELASIYRPVMSVGGDYFDFIEFAGGKIVFCIGDFTGKGLAAALLMANFRANFHTLINKRTALDEFIRDLNQSVNLITQGDKFITFFIAEFDLITRNLQYVNAGHNPPLLVTKNGIQQLDKGCIMLGSYAKIKDIEIGNCQINIEDEAIILAYTDGLIDIHNLEGETFSEAMLEKFSLEHHQFNATQFNQALQLYLDNFRNQQPYPDDFTVLTCKLYTGNSEN
jgi:sigma-B regulation protein RsbU (phosphoserine phosphatase)